MAGLSGQLRLEMVVTKNWRGGQLGMKYAMRHHQHQNPDTLFKYVLILAILKAPHLVDLTTRDPEAALLRKVRE